VRRFPPALAAAPLVALLGACSAGQVGPAEVAARAASMDAARAVAQARGLMEDAEERPVRIAEGFFVSALARRAENGQPLPARLERPDGVTLMRPEPLTLQEIAALVAEVSGIPVAVAPDVARGVGVMRQIATAGGAGGGGGSGSAGGMTPLPLAGVGQQALPPGVLGAVFGGAGPARMRVEHRGPLSGFLDRVASHFGVHWEYDRREIRLSHLMTRTFVVHALPADIGLVSRLDVNNSGQARGGGSGSGAGGGLAGGSSQQMSSEVRLRIWDDITRTVESIVGDEGKVEKSPATGTITVTAPRLVMARVARFMEAQNERLSRQVTVHVQLLSVDLSDGSDVRLDLQALADGLVRQGVRLSLGTAGSLANPLAPGVGVAVTQGRFDGTEAVIQALASRGRVSLRTATTVTTLNGVPAPVNVVNTRGYLAEVAVAQIPGIGNGLGGGVQTSLRPGTVTTGFSLNILPRIDRDGQTLLLQFSMNISELVGPRDGFNEYTSPNGGSIQLPNINSRNFVQQAEVRSGQTIIVTGFERAGDTAERRGTLFPDFMGLGGVQAGTRSRTALVILMTPRIVSSRPVVTME